MKQFGIIMAVTCVGELMNHYIPLPIPASIYGLVLMLVLLMTKMVKLHQVKESADFLIEIMPLMFIPSCVSLITSWTALKRLLLPLFVLTLLSTFIVMIVTAKVSEWILNKKEAKRND